MPNVVAPTIFQNYASVKIKLELEQISVLVVGRIYPEITCWTTFYGNELTYGLYKTGSRHDGIAIADKMEK
ncbi:LOW QUALITY PROTEIN: hypothetical protein PHMEG_00034865 [Phytophthora megakarya]|uniref:Uncharacterized protein n=1 Tax=Phytophthora megakarya TaxID=4795 RepID=A0A225UPZ8_9STRA|nr:LOW QUALITY PROTEIN: hypothetical protein PHMEG_00034865 [Phytophthora megakarya]